MELTFCLVKTEKSFIISDPLPTAPVPVTNFKHFMFSLQKGFVLFPTH